MAAKRRRGPGYADYRSALAEALERLPSAIYIHGAEEHLRREAIERLVAALARARPGAERLTLHGPVRGGEGGVSLADLLAECRTSSLFASERIVVLRRGEGTLFPQGGAEESAGESFSRLVENPGEDLHLLLECAGSHGQYALGKLLAKAAHGIPCPEIRRPEEAHSFLADLARRDGKSLPGEAAEMLIRAHGLALGTLAGELEKLIVYVGEEPAISIDDVETFLTGSIEFAVFGLTTAVEDGALPRALTFAGRILHIGTRDAQGRRSDADSSAHRALAMLSHTLENLLAARVAMAEGAEDEELASRLRISPFRARHLARAARRHPVAHLRQALGALASEIHATHDSGGDPARSLLRATVAACSRDPGARSAPRTSASS